VPLTSILDRIVGFSRDEIALEHADFEEILESQKVRILQSRLSLRLVAIVGLVIVVALWNQVPRVNLVIWIGLVILFAIVRALICTRVERSLDQVSVSGLYRNELWLYVTSIVSTTLQGSGYWWVCLGAEDRVVFTVTLLCCIYAVGTTVNSAMHASNIPELLISNLGQGVIFLALVQETPSFELALALVAMIIILTQFSKRIGALLSESIRMRDENRKKNQELEEQKMIIEQALQAAHAANDDKNRFMAAASHDLRQPLHAMTLFLGSLRRAVDSDLAIELVDKIDETTTVLHDQFNSLLDLSKFDAGVIEPNLSKIRLDLVLQKVVDGIQPLAQQKGLELNLDVNPIVINTDRRLVERMARNLIINAVKFTDKGSVHIRAKLDAVHGFRITVADTGQGIDEEDLRKIFMDYYQVHNRARSKGRGSGLGLAIVKRIAGLLAIDLAVESEANKGSAFSLTFPVAQVVGDPSDKELTDALDSGEPDNVISIAKDKLSGLRFLIVDDDQSIMDALSILISGWGGDCVMASSFDQVEELVKHDTQFDMAILDDMLSESSTGLDIAKYLKTFLTTERILITTGNTSRARLNTIRRNGFDVLIKPVGHQQLIDLIITATAS
jgi:signal transduction histidine kinase